MDIIDYGADSDTVREMLSRPDEYPAFCKWYHGREDPLYKWRPRPDNPDRMDEQTSFTNSTARFAICLGGTGSGKTEGAAAKTGRYLRGTPAPRKDTPFWIIGETYEMVCSVCWVEKLSKFIPQKYIRNIDWYKSVRGWPFSVILEDNHGTGTNWVVEFKSYEQGRAKFQAASIGGYWFNEEVPIEIVEEVQGRCREYDSPGWADFTPIEIKSDRWLELYDKPPPGWEFFHLNTAENFYLSPDWFENWIKTVPEDMRDTRQYGIFATRQGQVYKEWQPKVHVIEPFEIPEDWRRIRAIDFGFVNPFCCLWIARSPDGVYYIYDEHYAEQKLLSWHAEQINQREWGSIVCGNTWSDHDAQSRRELQEYGIHCTPAKKDVLPGIEHIRKKLMVQNGRSRLYVFSDCTNVIRQFRGYHWPPKIGTGDRMKDPNELPVPYDDHGVDAARYGIYSEDCGLVEHSAPVQRRKREWQTAGSRLGW